MFHYWTPRNHQKNMISVLQRCNNCWPDDYLKAYFLYKRKTVSMIQCMKVNRYVYKDIYIKKQLKSIDLYFSIAFCQRTLYIFIWTFYTQVLIHIPIENIWILDPFNPLSANPTKWSNTLKQFYGNNWQFFSVCLTISWG